MNKIQALNAFWNGFKLKAYDENSVPDGTDLPYITYESPIDDFDHSIASTASLWYRSSSWSEITQKAFEIYESITKGGIMIPYEGGSIWLRTASPWAQRMSDSSDDFVRRIILNLEIEFID